MVADGNAGFSYWDIDIGSGEVKIVRLQLIFRV